MIGERIAGYEIVRKLGAGSMGTVHLGERADRRVAIKVIHEHLQSSAGLMERFLREAEVGGRVRHPNVVPTYAAGSEVVRGRALHYMVMEYVEGRDLRGLLEDLGTVPEALLRETARQVAAGLAAIHAAGVIHRDLKPENVLITGTNDVRIMDLGVARLLDGTVGLTSGEGFTGTVLYASPEQLRGEDPGFPSDLYSLGVLLYELATGRNPFLRRDPGAILMAHLEHVPPPANDTNPDLSPFFAEVVGTLLAKAPETRFASAADLRSVLDEGEASRWWARREPDLLRQRLRLPRIPVQRTTALHGRREELALLEQHWRAARLGQGGWVHIEGELGIGKSRLLDALVEHAGRAEASVLYGACTPAGGLSGWMDSLVTFLGAADLGEALRPHVGPSHDLLPAFAARLLGRPPPAAAPGVDAEGLATLAHRLVRSLSSTRPLLWLLDDVHYAREEGRGLLRAVQAGTKEAAVLLVTTGLPGALSEVERARCTVLPLHRLGARDVVDLLADALQNDGLAERLSGKIAASSDGVPLVALELLRSLDEQGALARRKDGTWTQAKRFTEVQVPPTVREMMLERLAGLDDGDREVLDVAALQGPEFDAGLIASVLEEKPVHVLRRLAALERRLGLVRAQGGRYVFDQQQMRDTLRAEVPPGLAAEYHALLAEAHAARAPGAIDGAAAWFLAHHHLQGSRPKEALPHLDAALDDLDRRHEGDAFLDLLRLALGRAGLLEGLPRAALLLRLAERTTALGGRDDAEAPLREALQLAAAGGYREIGARGRFLHARIQLRRGDVEAARDALEEVRQLASEAGLVELEARATGTLGVILDNTDRHEEALGLLQHHLDVTRALGDRKSEMIAACNLGLALRNLGRLGEARALGERHLEIARVEHDLRAEGVALGNLAIVASDEGDLERAEDLVLQNVEIARRAGARHSEASASGQLGLDHLGAGRLQEAWTWLDREHDLAGELADAQEMARAAMNRASILHVLGKPALAAQVRRQAVALYRDLLNAPQAARAAYHLATHLEEAGRRKEAADALDDAWRQDRGQAPPDVRGYLLLGRARLAQDEAERRRLAAEALAQAPDHPWLRLRCLVLGVPPDGDARLAAAALPARMDAFDRLQREYLVWKACGDAGARAAARRMLDDLTRSAPPSQRATMRDGLAMYRDLTAA